MSNFLEEAARRIEASGGILYSIAESNGLTVRKYDSRLGSACRNSYSVAKSFAVAAVGLLYDEGKIDTDERIVDIFSDELPAGMDERWQTMTLHHVLKHACGFKTGYLDIDAVDSNSFGTDDYLRYLFDTRLCYSPGEGYSYSDAAYYIVSRVITKRSGCKLDDFLWQRLFYPLGFREVAWSRCPKGYPIGATGLYIYTEDMVKLGELYMCDGVYRGQRILSKEWVSIVKDREYEFHKICGGRGYVKGGAFGQMLAFFPDAQRAIAWHSYNGADILEWVGENI